MIRGLFALIFTMAATWGLLNYFGFCFKRLGFISNEEKISIAVEYVISTYPPVMNTRKSGERYRERPGSPIDYQSVSQFMRENPDCCKIIRVQERTGYKAPMEYRLLGSISDFVEVNYKVKYLDENKKATSKDATTYVAISNCGHPWSGM